MHRPITAVVLAAALAVSLVTLVAALRLPGNNQGYEPVQPIAYSHKLHAGDLQIQCIYCHSGADKSRHAGIPAMSVCMNCHSGVTRHARRRSAGREGRGGGEAGGEHHRLARTAEAVRRACARRNAVPEAGRDAEADRVEADPQAARLRVLRPSRAHHRLGPVPAVSRSDRNDGAGAAVRNAVDGLVRELPPRRQPRPAWPASRCMPRLTA